MLRLVQTFAGYFGKIFFFFSLAKLKLIEFSAAFAKKWKLNEIHLHVSILLKLVLFGDYLIFIPICT